jgi:rare lipoprotein A
VEVTAISFDKPGFDERPATRHRKVASETPSRAAPREVPKPQPEGDENTNIFVQVGAFGDPDNARRRITVLRNAGISSAFVLEDNRRSPALYRVRIGPIAGVDQYDALVAQLRNVGIIESHLVTE